MHFSASALLAPFSLFYSGADYAISGAILNEFYYIWCLFSIKILKNYSETAPSSSAIWCEFNEQLIAPKH